MPDEPKRVPDAAPLSEEAAHRLLARAIELDARRTARTFLREVREAALEAGVSAEAFEEAARELRESLRGSGALAPALAPTAPPRRPGLAPRLWRRLRGPELPSVADAAPGRSDLGARLWEGAVSGTLAIASFWAVLGLMSRVLGAVDAPWQARALVDVVVCALGAGVSFRLKTRRLGLLFAGLGVAEAIKLVMHLVFGIHAVQGGPVQWAVILAGVAGVAAGALLSRARADQPEAPGAGAHEAPGEAAAPEAPRQQPLLRLRFRTA